MSKRDTRIDFLRSVGIFLIILAHVSPPQWLSQIRSFDVPLMSMLLGMSFVLSTKNQKTLSGSYMHYVFKRFKRLIVPAWVFVTLYILFTSFMNGSFMYDLKDIIEYYTLLSDSYVWIIRVFFTIGIVSPLLIIIARIAKTLKQKILMTVLLLFIQIILVALNSQFSGLFGYLFEKLIAISFGYIIASLIGMLVVEHNKKENILFSYSMILLFLLVDFYKGFPLLASEKYPPTIFYLTYGIGIAVLLLYITSYSNIGTIINNKMTLWFSKHSLEIYYWHIFPLTFLKNEAPDLHWAVKLIFILSSTLVVTYLQTKYIPNFFYLKINNK